MPRVSLCLVSAFALALAASGPLWAAQSGAQGEHSPVTIPMRLGEHPDFDRIVFDAPAGTKYTLKKDGTSIVIAFSRAAKVTLPSKDLQRAKAFALLSGKEGEEPLSIRFVVSGQARIKEFYSGSSIVLDVTGPSVGSLPPEKPVAPAANMPKETPPAPPEPKPEPEKKAEVLPASLPAPPETTPAAPATIAPAPQAAPTAPVPPPDPLPEQKPEPFRSLALTLQSDPKAVEQIRSIIAETEPKPVAVLDPKLPIGAAIFARGGYVTVLFDRKLVRDALIGSPPPRVKLEPLELPQNTGFRIAIPDGVSVRATRKGTAWEVYLIRANQEGGLSTEFMPQPAFALGARLLVATGKPPAAVLFPDPVVGDDLIVLPFQETGAFSVRRRMADFQVVPAAQGLVIKPLHEHVLARATSDGIEITAEGGLNLSPAQDTGQYSGEGAPKQTGKTIYDFNRWGAGSNGESFTQSRQRLMQTVISVSDDEKILARLDIARFYFAQGMGKEALSILNVLAQKLPEITEHPDFLAVRGGASVLAGLYQNALKDLSFPALYDQPEALLWRAIASAGLRDWDVAMDGFAMTIDILMAYPEPLRSRYAILALESAAATGKDQKVLEWLNRFEKAGYAPTAEPAIRYLRGVLYSKAGRADMAEKLWHQVAKGPDRLYKIRAELALVDLGVATRSLTPKQAVDRLEGLRFAWRGDDLEFDILKRLGGFYIDAKNFRSGFTVYSQAMRLFPTSPLTPPLKAEMVRIFRDIYLTDLGNTLSPIDALSLYTDFKMLIPSGEEGNAVRKNLAERLINIDLLDQATKLLDDLFKNAPTPEERVKTATRLAGVQLLDHKAQAALTYLDQSQGEAQKLSQAVQDERQLLRVRALSELGKYAEALAAIPHNQERATMLLRADISMRAKNWPEVAKSMMDLVGPPEADKPLDDDKATWLVHAALAMAQSGDTSGLDRLAIDYGAAMDKSAKANLFKIITRPEKIGQMKDIRAAQSKLAEVDMFRGILDSYRNDKK